MLKLKKEFSSFFTSLFSKIFKFIKIKLYLVRFKCEQENVSMFESEIFSKFHILVKNLKKKAYRYFCSFDPKIFFLINQIIM